MASKPRSRMPDLPDLPESDQLKRLDVLCLTDDSTFESVLIAGCKADSRQRARISVRESIVSDVDVSETELSFVELTDVQLDRCDLANSRWDWFAANRVVFHTCRLLGFKAIESEMLSVKFESCNMQLSQFRFAKLAGAYFEGCDLRQADFSGADLTEATFDRCDLTSASFSKAKCRALDVRTSTITQLVVGPEELTGIIINPLQAADVVKVFGLTVLSEHEPLPGG